MGGWAVVRVPTANEGMLGNRMIAVAAEWLVGVGRVFRRGVHFYEGFEGIGR